MRAEATGLRESEEHTLVAVKMVKGQKVQHFHVLVFLVSLKAIILVIISHCDSCGYMLVSALDFFLTNFISGELCVRLCFL